MKDRCEGIRERMEYSVGRALGTDEQAALDLHCAECESCNEYRKRLIDDHSRLDRFAALHSPSELRAEERVIAALPAEVPVPARRGGIQCVIPRVPRAVCIAAAVTATIVVILGIDLLRGIHYGPVPAFASVVERMEQVENVIHRERSWQLGKWTTVQRGEDRLGFGRVEYADSTHIYSDRGPMQIVLRLYPSTKRAVVVRTTFPQRMYRETNPVKRMASWHKRDGFSFVRKERYEGKNAAVYESWTGKHFKWTTWVDLKTELPFRMEIVRNDTAELGGSYLYGLDVSDFMPAGSPRSAAAGWTDLAPGEAAMIFDNFQWNVQLDTLYFSLTPPPGYAVTTIDSVFDKQLLMKQAAEGTSGMGSDIARTFAVWISLSGGAFPDNIQELADSTRIKLLLVAKHNKDGKPGDEFRAAIQDAFQIHHSFINIEHMLEKDTFHYLGKGATFGDSTRIVCWGEESGDFREFFKNPYWIIYADLRCVPSKTPPMIPEK
jgi:hypothetical protein